PGQARRECGVNFLFDARAYTFSQALGRALLHSLWEGACVALLLGAALWLLRGRSPNARYAVACSALALMLLLPVLTAWGSGGLVYTRRLRRRGARVVAALWQERAEEISRRLLVGRPVRVLESALVSVPTAIGWLRPVVLLPASAFTGLTPRQLETILAHELAHIRRIAYLFNLLQPVAVSLLFYHPAAWWVSRRVRQEREL